MSCGKSGRRAGTADGARHGAHSPAAMREGELPVRERGVCARVGGAQLLPGLEDEVSDAASGRGGDGAGGHRTVPGGEGPPGLAGGRGAGRAGDAAAAKHQPLNGADAAPFAASEQIFRGLVGFLSGSAAAGLTHEELQTRLAADGRELHRQLVQDHLDLRAAREPRLPQVSDASGRARPAVEAGHQRALATEGWPIATGISEGACRHIVRDRMDLTGARWGLPGAEAILKLRAIRANGEWADYWRYHLKQEHRRLHEHRCADGVIPSTRAA